MLQIRRAGGTLCALSLSVTQAFAQTNVRVVAAVTPRASAAAGAVSIAPMSARPGALSALSIPDLSGGLPHPVQLEISVSPRFPDQRQAGEAAVTTALQPAQAATLSSISPKAAVRPALTEEIALAAAIPATVQDNAGRRNEGPASTLLAPGVLSRPEALDFLFDQRRALRGGVEDAPTVVPAATRSAASGLRKAALGVAAFGLVPLAAAPLLHVAQQAASTGEWGAQTLALLVGLAFGLRHALDPDHVIAVSNLIDSGKRKAWKLGLAWGLGHATTLLVVGGAMLAAKAAIPERLAASFEGAVALMLIGLGTAALLKRSVKPADPHAYAHSHFHPHEHLQQPPAPRSLRSFLIGLVHGLAGSGAAALLAVAAVPTTAGGLLYLTVFGAGTMAGMAVVTAMLGGLVSAAARGDRARKAVSLAAGALSISFGAYMLSMLLPLILN